VNPSEEPQEPSLGAPSEAPLAPAVTLVMVAHDPGPWFEESLGAVAAQDYPALEVVVVDTASLVPVADRVSAALPGATTIRLERNPGFGRAVNEVLPSLGIPPFLVLAHDDAAPDPTAVRTLVEEAFRSNAAIVGPKVVRWDDAARLLSAGEGADKFGFPVPLVERHELDQEQHDAVRDVFTVPDAFTLVRTDLLRALDGFDAHTSFFGDDLDLCWRAHVAGARVMVAPTARVRHIEALADRHAIDDRRRLQFRHRLRVMLTAYRLPTLALAVPQVLVVHLVEAVFAVLTGRPAQARDVLTAWTWNLRRLGSLRERRRALHRVRLVRDNEVRSLQVRGSARIAAFLRGQLAVGEDTFGSAASLGRRIVDGVAGPGRREALLAWSVVALVLLVGSRHLLTRPIPPIGEFVPFPEQLGPLVSEWASSWRRAGLGADGFAPSATVVVALGGSLFLGATGLLRTVLILGLLPLGLLGVWRLVAPVASPRASAAALLTYTAVPLGYDSLATGSWRGLAAYAVAPWVLARVLRAGGTAPFGAHDGAAGPRFDVPPLWRQGVALGLLVAATGVLDPLFLALPLFVWLAMIPGSLLLGGARGLGRMGLVALTALVVGAVVHAPWLVELLSTSPSWDTFTAGSSPDAVAGVPLTHLLRFDTGPIGSSALNAAVMVAATFAVLVGREWRLLNAVRGWSIAVGTWMVVWVAAMGWLRFGLPPVDVVLAPAAAALALCVGLGVSAFELDVRRSTFGWRQLASVVAVLALVVALLPVAAASVGGRWLVPRGSHHNALAFLADEIDDDAFRVLWFGDPEVLPLGSWPLGDLTSYATTVNGLPGLVDLWPGRPEGRGAPLRSSVELALDQRTNRLGRLLAPMGVRYLVVVDQGAPQPFGGVRRPSPPALREALAEQLDLVEVDVNPVLTVYRNAAWVPTASVLADGVVAPSGGPIVPDGAALAAGADLQRGATALERRGTTEFAATVPSGRDVLVGSTPAGRWRLEVDGVGVARSTAFGWAPFFDDVPAGHAELRWSTPAAHRLVLGAHLTVLVLLAALMYRTRVERRVARRHQRSLALPVEGGDR
jgi:GT2 family glycosyltransferase